MSKIDLIILGILYEKPQSAYDVQKDVEYHNLSRWTSISTPSIYKKIIKLKEMNYLNCIDTTGVKLTKKSIYTITDEGISYFELLMDNYASNQINFNLDFNIMITNLNKMEKGKAFILIRKLKENIIKSKKVNLKYLDEYNDIPLVGTTVLKQQDILYNSLLEWISEFEYKYKSSE